MQSDQSASFKAGVFVIVAGVILILGIMALGKREQLLTRHYTLWTEFTNAGGLIPGADVRVAGVTAGSVRGITIVKSKGRTPLVRVTLDLSENFLQHIRSDSRASIRTLGPLGDKYVEITMGTPAGRDLLPGEQIEADEPVDFYEIAEQMREALVRVGNLTDDIGKTLNQFNESAILKDAGASVTSFRKLLEGMQKGPGLVRSLLYDPEMPRMLDDLQVSVRGLRAAIDQVQAGKGDLGQLLHGNQLQKAFDDIAAAATCAKQILKEVQEGDGIAHALIYDPKQTKVIDDVREAAGATKNVMTEIEKGDGLAHAAIYDRKQRESLNQALANVDKASVRMDQILADIQEAKGTLGLLIADPALWDSLTRLTGGAEESRALKFLIRRALKEDAKKRAEKMKE